MFLENCFISVKTHEWLLTQLKYLECISLIKLIGINYEQWIRIKQQLIIKLIHFTFSGNNTYNENNTRIIDNIVINNSHKLQSI